MTMMTLGSSRWSLVTTALALTLTVAQSEKLVYLQSFDYVKLDGLAVPKSDREAALRSRPGICWCGGNSYDGFCDNPHPTYHGGKERKHLGGEGATPNVNRCPSPTEGPLTPGMASYWSSGNHAPVSDWLYTDALTCTSASELTRITWYHGDKLADDLAVLAFMVHNGTHNVWYVSTETFNDPNDKLVEEPGCTPWRHFDVTDLQSMEFRLVGPNLPDTGGFGSEALPTWPTSMETVTGLPDLPLAAFGYSWGDFRKRKGHSSVDEVALYATNAAECSVESGCQGAMCTCPHAVNQDDAVNTGRPFYEADGEVHGSCPGTSQLCAVSMDLSDKGVGDIFSCVTVESEETVQFRVTHLTENSLDFSLMGTDSKVITAVQVESSKSQALAHRLQRFVMIATSRTDPALILSNGVLGESKRVLSKKDPDLQSVFLDNATPNWAKDGNFNYLCGAALVHEGQTWTGDIAMTASNGKISMADDHLHGSLGIWGSNVKRTGIDQKAKFIKYGENKKNTLKKEGMLEVSDEDVEEMRAELYDLMSLFTQELETEFTLTSTGWSDDFEEFCIDAHDVNGDGFVVIDVDSGDSDFEINNGHWIIESVAHKFAVIRILGDKGFKLSNSGILIGDGVCGNVEAGKCDTPPEAPPMGIRAAIVRAKSYAGAGGTVLDGVNERDELFTLSNAVVNGVGFYDLASYSDASKNPNIGSTLTNVQNSQGCSQFVGSVLQFSNYNHWKCTTGWSTLYEDGGGCSASLQHDEDELGEVTICVDECGAADS